MSKRPLSPSTSTTTDIPTTTNAPTTKGDDRLGKRVKLSHPWIQTKLNQPVPAAGDQTNLSTKAAADIDAQMDDIEGTQDGDETPSNILPLTPNIYLTKDIDPDKMLVDESPRMNHQTKAILRTIPSNQPPAGVELSFLPAVLLRHLSESFLNNREIRDFGLASTQLFTVLAPCKISGEMTLSQAIAHQQGTQQGCPPSQVQRSIANTVRFGRFTHVCVMDHEKGLIPYDLGQLRDVHKLVILPETDRPFDLPLFLKELTFCQKSAPLSSFTLPDSVTSIRFPELSWETSLQNLTKVRWPVGLATLLNLRDYIAMDGLVLPDRLQTLTFTDPDLNPDYVPPFTTKLNTIRLPSSLTSLTLFLPAIPHQNLYDFTLPTSLINLAIKLPDGHPDLKDYAFPVSLQRLKLEVLGSHDLLFHEWQLSSCANLCVTVRDDPKGAAKAIDIRIPTQLIQLSVFRRRGNLYPRGPPQIQIDEPSSLTTIQLTASCLSQVKWPSRTLRPLTHMKLVDDDDGSTCTIQPHLLPRSLVELDLIDVQQPDIIPSPPVTQHYQWPALHTLSIGSYRYPMTELHLPPSLQRLSFVTCGEKDRLNVKKYRRIPGVIVPEARVYPPEAFLLPTRQELPNLSHLSLGRSTAAMREIWVTNFPTKCHVEYYTFHAHVIHMNNPRSFAVRYLRLVSDGPLVLPRGLQTGQEIEKEELIKRQLYDTIPTCSTQSIG